MKKFLTAITVAILLLLGGCGSESGTEISFNAAQDLNGNTYSSSELFGANKVTMVNVWATTCSSCVDEMPDLEELNEEMAPQGVEIVGVVNDITSLDQKDLMKDAMDIVNTTGVTYKNLIHWGDSKILSSPATPITYFVGSDGKTIGDAIIGAQSKENYKAAIEKALAAAES